MHIETININISAGASAMTSALIKAIMSSEPGEAPATDTEKAPAAVPRVGAHWPEQGGIYLGIMPGDDGKPDYHLILSGKDGEFKDKSWGGYGTDEPGAKSDNDGWANTMALLDSDTAHPAIDMAEEFVCSNGFYDWYVPARNELRLAYITAKQHFDTDTHYWSSTQSSDDDAWLQYFHGGNQGYGTKEFEARVRLVRRIQLST